MAAPNAYQLTIPAIMRRAAMLFGGTEIVSRSGDALHRYAYADMIRRAKQLAVALKALGVKPGDRIATLAWNEHRHLEAYFAIPSVAAVLHTLNLRLHPSDLSYIIQHAGDRVIFADRSLLPLIQPLPACVELVIAFGSGSSEWGGLDYEELIAEIDPARFE